MKHSGLVCIVIAALPAAAFAGAFDGTWKFDPAHLQMSKKPLVMNLTGNSYTCSSCTPSATLTADGTDQKLDGGTFDSVAVTVVGPNEVHIVRKLKGKTVTDIKDTVSKDSKTLTEEFTGYGGTAPVVVKVSMKRVAPAPDGAHALSGSWVATKMDSISDSGILETLGDTDTGFTMSGNGQSYDAKFDGKKYAVEGDATGTKVMVKRLGPSEIVETDSRHGKTVEVIHYTLAADGKSIAVVDTDTEQHSTDRYKLFKQ